MVTLQDLVACTKICTTKIYYVFVIHKVVEDEDASVML